MRTLISPVQHVPQNATENHIEMAESSIASMPESFENQPLLPTKYLLADFCKTNNITDVCVRPFVKINSVNQECDLYPKLNGIQDLQKNVHQYQPKAFGHQMCADAYFRSIVKLVSEYTLQNNKHREARQIN